MTKFPVDDIELFKHKALLWADKFHTFSFLDSNNYTQDNYHTFDSLLAVDSQFSVISSNDSFYQLKKFHKGNPGWLFGYFSYDLKNQVENLHSNNVDNLGFPDLYFFSPRYLLRFEDGNIFINRPYLEAVHIKEDIEAMEVTKFPPQKYRFQSRVTKEEYIRNVELLKENIIEGEIYEVNYCQEFYAENADFKPIDTFVQLNSESKAPFSACFKFNYFYILSMSPERFLKKEGQKIISQPIKGTIRKSKDPDENKKLQTELQNDIKERAENVMIVDLVRNDLSKSSLSGSIKVEELFGVYSFEKVNHLISTVVSELKENVHFLDVIQNAFPMGSMTGAPKIRAMELIEKYEATRRGVYSGSIGYIDPDNNFDFNVVIRSLQFNSRNKYLNYMVGGAITYLSDPLKEYEECLVKALAIESIWEKD